MDLKRLLLLNVVAVLTVVLPLAGIAGAQTIPTGFQEYHIIGNEEHIHEMFQIVGTDDFGNEMYSVIGVSSSVDNQAIYYDHWEDGFEADILNPVQSSTIVIGNGDPSDGDADDYTVDPRILNNVDIIFRGASFSFNSDQPAGNGLNSFVPIPHTLSATPVYPDEFRFDGGDRIVSTGGPLTVIHYQRPDSTYIGGSTEIISKQGVNNAFSYSIPVGTDTYTRYGGGNTSGEPFQYVYLNLVAYEDDTQIFVDNKSGLAGGTASFTLDKGEHWSSVGWIDTVVAPSIEILEGTKVSTTKPLAGLIFTGGPGTYQTRFYALLPDIMHSTDFITTAPGDDPAIATNRPLNIYIYNPNQNNSIEVTATDSVSTSVITVPANKVIAYAANEGGSPNRAVPSDSTVRLFSDSNFWGISAYEYDDIIVDWGHSWLATKFLTENYSISWSPGTDDPATSYGNRAPCDSVTPCNSFNRSPVFVAAVQDNTRVQIDLDNDGIFELVDTNSDDVPDFGPPGFAPCNTVDCNPTDPLNSTNPAYRIDYYPIDALQVLKIYDYTDYTNEGTQIHANKPIAVSYGQDTDQGENADPTLDLGNTVFPLNQIWLDPVLTLDKTASPTNVPTNPDSVTGLVTYVLTAQTYGFETITNISIYDFLPIGLDSDNYVADSTIITGPDGTVYSGSTYNPVDSIVSGRTKLDWTTVLPSFSMAANKTVTLQYQVDFSVDVPPALAKGLYTNNAGMAGDLGGSTFSPIASADVVVTDVTLGLSVDKAEAEPGEILTYTISLANSGTAENNAIITAPIPPGTIFDPAIQDPGFSGTFDPAQNAVIWTYGSFSGSDTLEYKVQINDGLDTNPGYLVENSVTYESDDTPAFESLTVQTDIIGPSLQIAKSGPTNVAPGGNVTFSITVENTGSGGAKNLKLVDYFPATTTYISGSLEYRVDGGAFISLTDSTSGDDYGYAYADRVEFLMPITDELPAGSDLEFRFTVEADAGLSPPDFINNQAIVSAKSFSPIDTNLVQVFILDEPVIIPAPVVSGPIYDDATSISGTSTAPVGTFIDVYVNDNFIGRTTVQTGGTWSLTGVSGLLEGDEVHAIATDGTDSSNESNTVVVIATGVTAPTPPVVSGPIYNGETFVSGTSASPTGSIITVFVDGVPVGTTVVNNGTWALQNIDPLLTGQDVTAIVTEIGVGTSGISNTVTVVDMPANVKRSSFHGLPVDAGDTISYTITLTNDDTVDWTDIEITDQVPDNTTLVSGSVLIDRPVDQVTGYYLDSFDAQQFNNSNGSISWSSSPWVETDNNGATGGDIRIDNDVSNYQLYIGDNEQETITRYVDLSAWSSASLSFNYRREGIQNSGEQVLLEINYGTGWELLQTFQGDDGSYQNWQEDLDSARFSSNVGFRFSTIGSANMGNGEGLWVDNFRIDVAFDPVNPLVGCDPAIPNWILFNDSCFTGDDVTLSPGERMIITFDVLVDDPILCGETEIVNTVEFTYNNGSAQTGPSSTATDPILPQDGDDDGILDSVEGCGDSDGDLIPNYLDLDSDNDGILDKVETTVDTDGDGVSDFLDLDSDNDGINDIEESGLNNTAMTTYDTDGDGQFDPTFLFGNNGLLDNIEAVAAESGDPDYDGDNSGPDSVFDTDGDGVADFRDLDSDNDSINDIIEGGGTDANGDGMLNGTVNSDGQMPGADNIAPDADSDGIEDYREIDSDNDGTNDIDEAGGSAVDLDNDGIIDDPIDTDGDGIPDITDGNPTVFGDLPDHDFDGIPDSIDIDDDNDGILDTVEGDGAVDTDGDGVPDSFDLDSDNDGINDIEESGLNNAEMVALDSDGDGMFDPSNKFGVNGLADDIEAGSPDSGNPDYNNDTFGPDTVFDTDGDSVPDFRDLDSDNDSINDVIEGGETDTDGNGLIDGTPHPVTGQIPGADNLAPDTDLDGTEDYRDLDSDGDTTPDIEEEGNGYLDLDDDGDIDDNTDGDGDGIPDVSDGLPATFGDAPPDHDNDGIPDNVDIDDDNDGILDSVEGNGETDTDGDGVPDSFDLDSDNDGINDIEESGLNATEMASYDANGDGTFDLTNSFGANGLLDDIEAGGAESGDPDYDNNGSGPDTVFDTDGDSVPDFRDLDSDNDSINDVIEGGETDANGDGLIDGTPNSYTGQIPGADNVAPDADLDGNEDYREIDSDNDGTNDIDEAGASAIDTNNDGLVDTTTDTDGDGIIDLADGNPTVFGDLPDHDFDGIPDSVDIDDDNDGILDTVEGDGSVDTDGDGVPDSFDLDSDNDGINDIEESGLDDGVYNMAALDSDGDGMFDPTVAVGANGLVDAIEAGAVDSGNPDYDDNGSGPDTVFDTDGDSVPDFRDLDSDNDSINDVIEGGETDADGNGLIDGTPDSVFGKIPGADNDAPNTDGLGAEDYRDLDSDNDGTPDIEEEGNGYLDDDNDGIVDDTNDTDGDGIPDESDGLPGTFGDAPPDHDLDGIPDNVDIDDDNDGILDSVEGNGETDTDGDGVPDSFDLDSDNDGINDIEESGLNDDDMRDFDLDGDGAFDLPIDNALNDFGSNGLLDRMEAGAADSGNPDYDGDGSGPDGTFDTDSDGIFDFRDLDTDNDSVNDVLEGGGTDTNGDGLLDGIPDPISGQIPGADNDAPDSDIPQDGIEDYREVDSDDDGINDIDEAGAGILDGNDDGLVDNTNDSDGDGIADVADGNVGVFGDLPDNDFDNIPDSVDLDDDNDGILDSVEGSADPDGDGIPNYLDPDSDGDGVWDLIEGNDGDHDGYNDAAVLDANNDGIIDTIADTNNNGVDDLYDTTPASIPNNDGSDNVDYLDTDDDNDTIPTIGENPNGNDTWADDDSDGDGIPNYLDPDSDSDGDGIPDIIEGTDDEDGDTRPNYLDIDSDNDGILDSIELLGDPDGDSIPNYLDPDSDGDGVWDNIEGNDSDLNGYNDNVAVFDTDDDGVFDFINDINENGLDDSYELPGGAAAIQNTDGTDNVDYLDTDDDNDNILTEDEDNNGNSNWADDDADGDLRPDYLDSDVLPDLLRNDELMTIDPLSKTLASIFVQSYPLDPALDGMGTNMNPDEGEGSGQEGNGSADDDDFYQRSIPPTGWYDNDPTVLTDNTRPLVYYELNCSDCTLFVKKDGGQILITYTTP